MRSAFLLRGLTLAVVLASSATASAGAEPAVHGSWQNEDQVKARLVADAGTTAAGERLVGIEMILKDGWKTYWRTPGTSGVPPSFNWSESTNIAQVDVLYPAPRRYVDKDDHTIGYKGAVLWPVLVRMTSPNAVARVKLALEIGVCKDVCIPVQLDLIMTLPAQAGNRAQPTVTPWLERVPRPADKRRPGDPEIISIQSKLKTERPHVLVTARYPGKAEDPDLFAEAPDGLYVPLPTAMVQPDGRTVVFDIDLSRDVELKDLIGRSLRFTLIGAAGAIEQQWTLE